MSDYIERDAVLRHYKDVDKSLVDSLSHAILKALTVHVEDLPAADVAPVLRGKWQILADREHYMCSRCGYIVRAWGQRFRFCANCGAKNDGGDKDD